MLIKPSHPKHLPRKHPPRNLHTTSNVQNAASRPFLTKRPRGELPSNRHGTGEGIDPTKRKSHPRSRGTEKKKTKGGEGEEKGGCLKKEQTAR